MVLGALQSLGPMYTVDVSGRRIDQAGSRQGTQGVGGEDLPHGRHRLRVTIAGIIGRWSPTGGGLDPPGGFEGDAIGVGEIDRMESALTRVRAT